VQTFYIMLQGITSYCKESYDELVHKVTWPSSKELTSSAVMVLCASIIIALVVFVMDSLFEWLMSLVYSFFN
jgi:preprotein translocase subunit SecE